MAVNGNSVGNYFEKFSSTTVIRVFSFISRSTFLIERFFWIAVLVVFSSATIWSVTETISTFISEPTASEISYERLGAADGLQFNNTVVCLEMLPDKLADLYAKSVDPLIDEITQNSNFLKSIEKRLSKINEIEENRFSLMRSSLKNETSLKGSNELLASHSHYEKSILDLFSENEVAFLGLTTAMFSRLVDLEVDPKPFHVEWASPAVEKLYEAYIREGISFSEIFSLVGPMTCVLLQMRVLLSTYDEGTALTNYTARNPCRLRSSMRYFGVLGRSESICYRLSTKDDPLVIQSEFDGIFITLHAEWFYEQFAVDLRRITIYPEDQHALTAASFNAKQKIDFSLETYSILSNLRRRPCAAVETRKGNFEECQHWCRAESIALACNCTPLFQQLMPSFGRLPENSASCARLFGRNFIDEKCRLALSRKYADRKNCSQQCHTNCEVSIFGSTLQPATTAAIFANTSTVVALALTKFVFQVVKEYVTMDLKGFIAALGGNLSLYLGASFLALIHIAVFFVRLPFEGACKKTPEAENRESESTDKTGGISIAFLSQQLQVVLQEISDLKQNVVFRENAVQNMERNV